MLRGSLEENTLTALCWHEQASAQLLLTITPDQFDSVHFKKIADRAINYIKQYGRPPRAHIRDLFETELRRPDSRTYKEIFDAMEALAKELQVEYVLDRLEAFITAAEIRKAMGEASTALLNDDVEAARQALSKREIEPSFTAGIWLHKPQQMLKFLDKKNDEDLFSSGIDEFDTRNIRPARQQIMVMVAPPKAGKSWYLINQAKRNLLLRKSVLHITCENSELLTAKRYCMCFFGMSTYQISNLSLPFFRRLEDGGATLEFQELADDPLVINEDQRKYMADRLAALSRRPLLHIKHFPSGTLTVPMIGAYIDMLERSEGFKPDLVVVDYPKMMKLDMRNYRLDLGRTLIDLRGQIADARNIAVSTVMQGSKESKSAHLVTSVMTAEDYSVVGTADTVCAYSQTSDERKRGLARMLADASRDAPDSFIVMLSQNYATGQFCLDSAYMTSDLESEAERALGRRVRETVEEEDEVC